MLDSVAAHHYVEALAFAKSHSKDPFATFGCALLPADGGPALYGCNRLPPGVLDQAQRWVRPHRYLFVEHAPRAVIYEALRRGVDLKGAWLVCTEFPAADCVRALIGAGIAGISSPPAANPTRPASFASPYKGAALEMLREAGIRVHTVNMQEPDILTSSVADLASAQAVG